MCNKKTLGSLQHCLLIQTNDSDEYVTVLYRVVERDTGMEM